jgi:hypothetical protein
VHIGLAGASVPVVQQACWWKHTTRAKEGTPTEAEVMEKVSPLDQLDDKEKKSIFKIIDGLISKKKMKDSLAKALAQ